MFELVVSLLMIASSVYWLVALRSAGIFLKAQAISKFGADSTLVLADKCRESLRHFVRHGWAERECPKVLVAFLRLVDLLLRRYYSIYEFSGDETCLLRLAIGENNQEMTLADGTHIPVGEPIGELHLWNEHAPPIPRDGPDLAWARTFQRRMTRSLRDLVLHIEANPALDGIRAFRGGCHFGSGSETDTEIVSDLLKRWSFELTPREGPKGIFGRIMNFWDKVYIVSLIWTFNPASLKGKSILRLKREYIWISRDTLIEKYGSRQTSCASERVGEQRRLRVTEESSKSPAPIPRGVRIHTETERLKLKWVSMYSTPNVRTPAKR